MIRSLLVLGGGSAGLLAALSVKTHLPELRVVLVRSRELGVIGVGEGSTVGLPSFLHGYLGIEPSEFFKTARPTWKLGLRFVEWGPRSHFHYSFAPSMFLRWNGLPKLGAFYCMEDMQDANFASAMMDENRVFLRTPEGGIQMTREFGYHLENREFVDFLEKRAAEIGIHLLDDKIARIETNEAGVSAVHLESGGEQRADLYLDCTGFVSLALGKALGEPFYSFRSTLFCDRSIIGGWPRGSEPIKPYTSVQAMSAGWCWQIEHEHRINRGYVYSSAFISDEEAEREFRSQNPLIEQTRMVKFVSGRYERAWVGNIVAIGNACGFVEPLEATSLGAISSEAAALVEVLQDSDGNPTPSQVRMFNYRVGESWDNIRRFLAIHYRFNTRQRTPFWDACRADTDLAGAEPMVEFYRENGPSDLGRLSLLSPFDQFTMDGWLTLLVGQKVPTTRAYTPSAAEADLWAKLQGHIRSRAKQAFTIPEALAAVRSPHWKWNREFFLR